MTKHYINTFHETVTTNAGGTRAVCDCLGTVATDLIEEIDNISLETEVVGVHKAKLVIRVTLADDESFAAFTAVPISYLTDGTRANHAPATSISNHLMTHMMNGFSLTGEMGWKLLCDPKLSAPIKAMNASVAIHQITFVIDVKKICAEVAKITDDPLTTVAYKAGFAVLLDGSLSTTTYSVVSSLHMEYTLHDRPMRTFARKTL